MSDAVPPTRSGLPDPMTVVSESTLRPPARPADVAMAPPSTVYRILHTTQVDPKDEPLAESELPTLGRERFAGEQFRGHARKTAKLSIPDAVPEDFADVTALIATLPAHEAMVHHHPQIGTDEGSNRVSEEVRNIRLRAFLYAASREDDNDYHLIVGGDQGQPPTYMTMEISGLPPAESPASATLKAARDAFKGFFGDQLPAASYDFYDPPIPIDIAGSLLFDMSHATGSRPGPQDLRPHMPVVWEVHPISAIVFEP
jgi:hypothetical protein